MGERAGGPDLAIEGSLLHRWRTVVGVDEVGRGALAGPLVVGAVAVSALTPAPEGLRDSKQLTERARERLREPIEQWAEQCALGVASVSEVETFGLRGALALAIDRALGCLSLHSATVILDGPLDLLASPGVRSAPWPQIAHRDISRTPVVRGDARCASVAAASILAKVSRDATMRDLAQSSPEYGWERNKGYGTAAHLDAIARYGVTASHRRSWCRERPAQLELSGESQG